MTVTMDYKFFRDLVTENEKLQAIVKNPATRISNDIVALSLGIAGPHPTFATMRKALEAALEAMNHD